MIGETGKVVKKETGEKRDEEKGGGSIGGDNANVVHVCEFEKEERLGTKTKTSEEARN